jgi:hypothetical protein
MEAWLEWARMVDQAQAERDEFDEAHATDRERARRQWEAARRAAGIPQRESMPIAAGGRTVFDPRPRIGRSPT